MAERLQRSIRFGARSVARLGGDEFCAMLEGVADAEEAENVASRVAEQLVGPYSVGGHEVPGVAASVGVAVRPPGAGSSAGKLLREADLAMYQTKRHTR